LLHAPIDASAKPEIPQLHEAGLIETISNEAGGSRIRLTPEGNAVLRGLGVK
jgi:DNA-binding MarR family transcriptional regulator